MDSGSFRALRAPMPKTFVLACAGTAVFWALGLPLPFLFGPMAACLLAAFAGQDLKGFGSVSVAARSILGVAVGASVTPELIRALPHLAASVAVIPAYVAVIGLIGIPFFRRVHGYDRATAYYAAMPGGLQDMVLFGIEAGGDARALSLTHATRVLIVVTLAPILLTLLFGVTLDAPIGMPAAEIAPWDLAMMALAAVAGWVAAARAGLFGAAILGPLIAAAALSLAGLLESRPPAEAILLAQFLIGTGLGVHYVGITLGEFRRIVVAAVSFVALVSALAAILAFALPRIAGLGEVEAFLAFAPGGQAEMTILAIVAGADLGAVIVHHLVRIVLVITCAPLAARWLGFSGRPPD